MENSFPQTSKHYDLRPRPHNYVLPQKDDRNNIPRHLYNCLNKKLTHLRIVNVTYRKETRNLIKLLTLFNF